MDPSNNTDPSFWYWPQSTTAAESAIITEHKHNPNLLQPSSPPSPSSSNSNSSSPHHIDLSVSTRPGNSDVVGTNTTPIEGTAVVKVDSNNDVPLSLQHSSHQSTSAINNNNTNSESITEHSRPGAVDLPTLAELSGELAMSLSPKHSSHTTPFSVQDILSPLEESYRIKSLDGTTSASLALASSSPPPSPYNRQSSTGSQSSAGTMNVPSTSPYTHMHVPQLSHPGAAAFPSQYCNGADLHGAMTGHYGDVRSSATAGWYGATATDPRFASKLKNKYSVGTPLRLSHRQLPSYR